MTLEEAISTTGNLWIETDNLKGVRFGNFVTLPKYADLEDEVAVKVCQMVQQSKPWATESTARRYIADYEAETGHKLHSHQADAVVMIAKNDLSVLTGGPGTGKTTTVACAAYVLRKIRDCRLVFAAPTGKAARRIGEQTGERASTLHHMLGLGYKNTMPKDVDADVLFIDESSMNDIDLTAALFRTSLVGKKLVWIGDVDQIPSVGPGAVLRDFIRSGVVPTTMLTKTFRQGDGSLLLKNIKESREGSCRFGVKADESYEVRLKNDAPWEDIDKQIVDIYFQEAKKYGMDNVAVLLPYRKAQYCSDRVNKIIQDRANKRKGAQIGEKLTLKEGDPVMQLVNRPECVNGEVGKVKAITPDTVVVEFTDTTVTYNMKAAEEQLTLAYAMSITKSQGSEYKSVILVLLNCHENALNRNILYTGMSRAKEKLTIVYQQSGLITAVNATASERKTFLAEKIKAVAGL